LSLVGSVPMFPGTSPPLPVRLSTTPIVRRVIERFQKSGEAGVLEIADIFGERNSIQEYPALIRAIAAHEADPKARAAGQSEFRSLMTLRGWRPSIALRDEHLETLQTPTTIVWGAHDPLGLPDDVRRGIELIPDVSFTTVEAGHMPFLAHPTTCAEVIRQLRNWHTVRILGEVRSTIPGRDPPTCWIHPLYSARVFWQSRGAVSIGDWFSECPPVWLYANRGGNHSPYDHRTKATALHSIGEPFCRFRAITPLENMGAAGSGSTIERIDLWGV